MILGLLQLLSELVLSQKSDKLEPISEWHSRGQRFDPAYLHQLTEYIVRAKVPISLWFRYFFFIVGFYYFGKGKQNR